MEPISMDALPNELHDELSNFLSNDDLQAIRTVSQRWNKTARYKLRERRGKQTFTFDTVAELAQFNTTFVNYEPKKDFASAKFSFKLPVLVSEEASEHLDAFQETVGTVVKSLVLNFSKPLGVLGFPPEVKVVVDRNVARLLLKVKGQLEKFRIQCYRDLCPSVLGAEPFSALRILKIQNRVPAEAVEEAYPPEAIEGGPSRRTAADEAFVLALSEKVPAIEQFSFCAYTPSPHGDPAFLPTVLRNLLRANSDVSVKLVLKQKLTPFHPAFWPDLVTVPVKVTDLSLLISTRDKTDELRTILNWISAQSDSLRKLTFYDTGERSHQGLYQTELKFPRMRVLEDLMYYPLAAISLLPNGSTAHFPNLRRLRTLLHGNDWIAPLPTVTQLVLLNVTQILPCGQTEEDAKQLLALTPFPNVTSLCCTDAFCHYEPLRRLRHLTRLHLTPHVLTAMRQDLFWEFVTHGVQKLTLDEILALPDNNNIVYVDIHFRDLESLKELVVTLMRGCEAAATSQLDTLVYLSKTKRLQRLPKLVIDIAPNNVKTFFDEDFVVFQRFTRLPNLAPQVSEKHLEELGRYHDSVTVRKVANKFDENLTANTT